MIGYLRRSKRLRKTARGSSFKPLLDLLEDRVQPSVAVIPHEPLMPIDPSLPFGGTSGVISVSTQELDLTRGGPAESFTIVLNSQPTAEVDITLAAYDPNADSDGTTISIDQPHLAFTADDWSTPQTVNVAAAAGSTPLPDAYLQLFGTSTSSDSNFDAQAVPPIGVNVTDPAPTGGITLSTDQLKVQVGGPSVTYTVVLNSQPTADVTVAISQASPILDPPAPGMAAPIAIVNFQPLTITPETLTFTADNWDQPQTITVSAPAPTDAFTHYAPFTYLDSTVSSDDPNYDGISVTPVQVQVATPQPTGAIVVNTQSLTVTAGGPSVTYTIALASQPDADVTVTINQFSPIVDPPLPMATAIAYPIFGGTKLDVTPQTLTFTADDWSTPQTVTVSAPAGSVGPFGGFAQLTAAATSDDPNYNDLTGPSVAVKVQNNPAYSLVVSTDHLALAPGASATYTVALASAPTDAVTVTLSPENGWPWLYGGAMPPIRIGDVSVTVAPTTLVFTPDNWNTPQTVTASTSTGTAGTPVFASNWIAYSFSSNDPNWNNLIVQPTTVTVTNGEGPLPIDTGIHAANTHPARTITRLSAPAHAIVGQPVTLTAHVRAPAAHAAAPTGSITFMDGKTALGTVDLTNGVANLTLGTLGVGGHRLTAVFASTDTTEAGSTSAPVHTTIRKAATATTLSVTTSPPTAGAAPTVTLTAQVTVVAPGVAPVNGVVVFRDHQHVLGTANVVNGVATLNVTSLKHGKHRFTATYQVTADTLASTSPPVIIAMA